MHPRIVSISGRVALTLISFMFALGACSPDARVDVRGHDVVVHVQGLEPGDVVTIEGIDGFQAVAEYEYVSLEIPAEKVGEGPQELTVQVTRGGKTTTGKVSVDVPASALAPYVQIMGCTLGDDVVGRAVRLQSDAIFGGGGERLCLLQSTGAVEVELTANTDAELKFGGAAFRLDSGEGKVMVPLTAAFGQMALEDLGKASPAKKLEAPMELSATRGGNTKTFNVRAVMDHEAVHNAVAEMLSTIEDGKPPVWPRSSHDGEPRGLVMLVEPHPVQIGGEETLVRHRDFETLLVAGTARKVGEIDRFAVATPVEATTLKTCRSGPLGALARVAMGFDVGVYDHTGKRVAQRRFEKPKETTCPRFEGGEIVWAKRGEGTQAYVYAPAKQDVAQWLTTQVE